jgi:cytochrome c553
MLCAHSAPDALARVTVTRPTTKAAGGTPSILEEDPYVRVLAFPAAALLAAAAFAAQAQAPAPEVIGRDLAATCANCHGTNGKAAAGSLVPGLAGRPKEEIARITNEFRDGKRQATIMHQLAKGFTPAQVDLLAAWFAAQK